MYDKIKDFDSDYVKGSLWKTIKGFTLVILITRTSERIVEHYDHERVDILEEFSNRVVDIHHEEYAIAQE